MGVVRVSILALLMWCAVAVVARAEIAVPQLTGRVVDQTATLTGDAIARLADKLKDLQARKGSQIAVLIVPTTDGEAIEQFGIRVAESWKIGRKKIDDGAILLIAKADRKLRIEVGYGLEGALNDITAKRIIDEIITPKFKAGDFDGGVEAGIDRMIGVIDGEPLPVPQPQHEWSGNEDWTGLLTALGLGTLFINAFLRGFVGRLPAAIVSGIAAAAFAFVIIEAAWYLAAGIGAAVFALGLVFDFTNSRGSRGGGFSGGGSSGGSSSWSSGSSSSSDSGFSGGGGSFGGGGASGSW